ncbi:MAG TPA: hypothetical protein VM512_09410 [Burkholderiaceae bacterium]|jgi:hypothetical protein|nr:hypothetical protein [Burkholderiaceae bacterium]
MATALDRTRIQIARPDILAHFDAQPPVMRGKQIAAVLTQERAGWRLAKHTTTADFIDFLKEYGSLREIAFAFPAGGETLYVWGKRPVPTLELLLHLKPRSYYSHYTAMRLHGLTEQVPKVLYLSHERASDAPTGTPLSQSAIDAAFQRPVRVSSNAVDFEDWQVLLINSANTGELGVVDHDAQRGAEGRVNVRTTSVERTLIDAAVRPAYSGGVFEVAKAFELAKDGVSVNAMGAMLGKLRFTYPYHQAIGFYLERAGYRSSALDLMRRFPMEFDFYLTHEMSATRYVPAWRLHVPEGF